MAGEKCVKILKEEFGVSDKQAKDITTLARDRAGELKAEFGGKSFEKQKEILAEAISNLIENKRRANQLERLNTVNDTRIMQAMMSEWEKVQSSDVVLKGEMDFTDFLEANLVGTAVRAYGARNSVASAITVEYRAVMGHLENKANAIEDKYQMKRGSIFKELSAQGVTPVKTEFIRAAAYPDQPGTINPWISEFAAEWNNMAEHLRLRENRAGANIAKIPGGYYPQSHNPDSLRKVTPEEWIKDIEEALDWNTTMVDLPPTWRQEVLRKMYEDFKIGRDPFLNFEQRKDLSGKGKMTTGHHRVLHFKSPEAFMAYNAKYGEDNIMMGMNNYIRKTTERLAVRERFGSDPVGMLDRLVKLEDLRLKGIAKDPNASAEARKAAVKQQAKLSKAYQSGGVIRRGKLINQLIEVMGETRLATNVTVAKIGAAARTVNMLSRMGLSGIAAVNDAGMAMHIQRSWGMKAADRYSGVVKDYFKRYKGDMRRFAKEHGFLMEMVLGDAMNRLDAGRENLGKGLSWITNFFYKVNGLTYLTQQKQVAMAIALSHHIGYNIKGMSWDSILPQVRGGLEFHGIGQDKLPLLQGMLEEIGDRTFLNATLARNLTNEQLDEFLPPLYRQDPKRGKRMSDEEYADVLEAWEQQKDTERARLRGSLETSVLSLFADDARYGAMEPDAAARAFMYRGTEGGDYTGEALRGVWQFKSFPLMVWQRHLKGRSWQKFGSDGRITEDIPGAIHMITWLTGMGLLTNTLRDLASGKEPKDPRKVATWLEAIKMGGAGGILGDMLLQQNPERGGAISNFVMGPSLQTAEDIIDTAAQLVQGEFGAAGKTALGVVTDNIPFKNFWATKAAMDYYLFHSAKMTNNPNYIKNSERQMNENFNQGYWMY